MRSKAGAEQLNIPHGTKNVKSEKEIGLTKNKNVYDQK